MSGRTAAQGVDRLGWESAASAISELVNLLLWLAPRVLTCRSTGSSPQFLAADVVGYSRLAASDEERTLARMRALWSDLIAPTIALHHGRVVKRTGDGSIVEFRSVVDAVRCAIEVQDGMVERNAGLPPERRIEFRVGIHLGDVVEETDGDLIGNGVNIFEPKSEPFTLAG
jgi:class 3 adenylate cyclase